MEVPCSYREVYIEAVSFRRIATVEQLQLEYTHTHTHKEYFRGYSFLLFLQMKVKSHVLMDN